MSDLRSRQKLQRRKAIIEAAEALIGEKGYRNTSIEEIAEKAGVGPATVYNYFGSKSELIIYIFHGETETFLKNGRSILDCPPESAEEGVIRLFEAYFSDFTERYSRKLIREVFVAVLVEQLSVRRLFMRLDYALMAQLEELLEAYRSSGRIRDDFDTADITFIIYSVIMTNLTAFFVDDDMSPGAFFESLRRYISIAFRGFTR